MKKSNFTEEQIAYALRQVESGSPPADVCRQLEVSEAIFHIWKKKIRAPGRQRAGEATRARGLGGHPKPAINRHLKTGN